MNDKSMTIAELLEEAWQTSEEHGWHDDRKTIVGDLLLLHSEVSEVAEELRCGHFPNESYVECGKPCGVPSEMADILIRLADTCRHYGIDLESALKTKLAYNKTRLFRHGGKVF
jgi:NTP pyrophosphatase (non-canonical NTP hydrolase)